MKTNSIIVSALCLFSMNSTLQAHELYGGIAVNSFDFVIGSDKEVSPTGVSGRLGAYLTSNLGLELHVGFGISEDTVDNTITKIALDIDEHWGAYLRPEMVVSEGFNVYGLVGYADVNAIRTTGVRETSFQDEGLSVGVGAEVDFGSGVEGVVEYMRLLDEANIDTETLGLGIKVRF